MKRFAMWTEEKNSAIERDGIFIVHIPFSKFQIFDRVFQKQVNN